MNYVHQCLVAYSDYRIWSVVGTASYDELKTERNLGAFYSKYYWENRLKHIKNY